jgi:hypothetical protein
MEAAQAIGLRDRIGRGLGSRVSPQAVQVRLSPGALPNSIG